jgi:hypothetical protein
MVGVVRDRASLCAFWCDRARDHWAGAAGNRLRGHPGEKARGEFEDVTRGKRQGFDDLWLDRQKQRRRSHSDRARHGIDSCRSGEAKTGARRSNRCIYAGNAGNRRRRWEPCSRVSSPSRLPAIGRRIACGIAGRPSFSLAFASGSVVTTEPGFTRSHEKSMTIPTFQCCNAFALNESCRNTT